MIDEPKKRGRPAGLGRGRGEGVMLRLHPPLKDRLGAWIEAQPDPKPSKPEAIRQLVEIGLEHSK
mgnify:CR=1 FL=1